MENTEKSAVDITESPILRHGTREWFDNNVGEFVIKHHHDSFPIQDDEFEFGVMKVVPGEHGAAIEEGGNNEPYYVAATPYRQSLWCGKTPESAIGSMLKGLALYARSGHLNPNCPSEPGDPPIQHAMHILSERLAWQIERRHDNLSEAAEVPGITESQPELSQKAARSSDIIAALSTAIAALARVKDL